MNEKYRLSTINQSLTTSYEADFTQVLLKEDQQKLTRTFNVTFI